VKFVLKAIDKLSPALASINKRFAKVGAAGAGFRKVLGNITRAGISMAQNILGGLASLSKKFLLLGTVAATAFGIIIRSSISTTDRLNKTAGKIGTTTEELSRLRYAAELTGVAQNNLDMALQRFTRRAAEAAAGTGEAKNALKRLGVDAQELVRLPLSERMLVLADAFGKIDDKPQKLALAFKLFDSEGAQLVTTLDAGREAIEEMMLEADLLGVTMDQSLADKTSKAEDAITRLKGLFGGLTRQVAAQLSPAITTFVTILKDKLLEKIKESNGSVQEFARNLGISILKGVRSAIIGIANFVNFIGRGINTLQNKLNALKAQSASADLAHLTRETLKFSKIYDTLRKGEELSFKQKFFAKIAGVPAELEAVTEHIEDLMYRAHIAEEDMLQGEPKQWQDVLNPDGLTAILDEMVASMNEASAGITDGFTTPTVQAVTEMGARFNEAVQNASSAMVTTTRSALSAVASGGQQIIQTLMNVTEHGSKEHKALFLISKGIAVAQAIINAQTAGAATLAGYAAALPMVALGGPAAVTAWQAKGLAMASTVTAMGYANAALIAATAVKSYDGGGFTGTGSRTGGVDGKGGFPAILHPNETVIDHTKGQMIGGQPSVVINQTLNITTGVESTVRAEIANLMPQIAEATSSAVAQQRMRGGNYSRQLLGR
jgi:hypothetical protein